MSPRRTSSDPAAPSALVQWRRRCLLAAGFPGELADVLAGDLEADLHRLLALTDRGCPPRLAARILAPLNGDTGSHPWHR
jgi:hypothetical protein